MITLTLKWIVTIFKYCFPSEWIWYNFKWSVDIFVWFDNFCLPLCYWHVTLCTITLQRTPHTLVWAKLKGYPFWPAKVSLLYSQHLCLTGKLCESGLSRVFIWKHIFLNAFLWLMVNIIIFIKKIVIFGIWCSIIHINELLNEISSLGNKYR